MTLIEWRTSADAVIVEMMRKSSRKREEKRTDATLAVTLVDAEHRNVSPEVSFTMRRLLADYYSDGMGYALSICLWEELDCQRPLWAGKKKGMRLVQGRRGGAYSGKRTGSVLGDAG